LNCNCINTVETEILRIYEGKFQSCRAETVNNNFAVFFSAGIPNINEHKIKFEVLYCPFCGNKVGK